MLQLVHHKEKLAVLQQNLSTTQDELSARVSDMAQLERSQHHLSLDLNAAREHTASCDLKISQLNQTIGNTDLCLRRMYYVCTCMYAMLQFQFWWRRSCPS